MSSAVSAASSATGMSEVPADTTPIRAPVGAGAVRETTTARASACQTASGTASRTARAGFGGGSGDKRLTGGFPERANDLHHLLGSLAFGQHHLGKAPPEFPVMVEAREGRPAVLADGFEGKAEHAARRPPG